MRRNLRAARRAAKLTQTELGAVVGLRRSQISFLERGAHDTSMRTWLKLSEFFNLPIEHLWRPTEEPSAAANAPENAKETT